MNQSTTYQINFSGGDSIQTINNIQTNLNQLSRTVNNIRQISLNAFVENIKNFADSIKDLAAPGADFQQQIADLQAITGIAGKDLKSLADNAREVGKATGLGASGAAEAYKLLASNIDIATIGGVEGLKKLQKETITLAQASGVDMATAADTMSNTINQFRLGAEDATRVINVLGAGAKYGAAEIPHLAESLKYVGPVAGAAGVSIEQTVAALEVLSQSGIKAGQSGTDLSAIMVKMQAVLGVDIAKVGMPAALDALKPRLKDVEFLTKTFGLENLKSIQTLIAHSDAVQEMTDKVTGTSTAYEQAKIRTETYKTTVEKIKARFDDLKISIFNSTGAMMPYIEVMSQGFAEVSRLVPALNLMGSFMKTLANRTGIATVAMRIFNAVTKMNPIGLLITAVTTLAGAFLLLKRRTDASRIAQKEWNNINLDVQKNILREKMDAQELLKVAGDEKRSYDDRKAAMIKLKEISAEYFGNLSVWTAATKEGTNAFNDYAAGIEKAATAEALKEYLVEQKKKELEIQNQGNRKWAGFLYAAKNPISGLIGGISGLLGSPIANQVVDKQENARKNRLLKETGVKISMAKGRLDALYPSKLGLPYADAANKDKYLNLTTGDIVINTSNNIQDPVAIGKAVRKELQAFVADYSLTAP